MCRKAADHDVVGIAINFRLTDGSVGHRLVDQFQDVATAADWIFSHSPDLEIDRHRVCAFGSSSGGHLAVLLALQKHDERPRIACAVDEFGPVDLISYRPPIARLFGPVSYRELPAIERTWSPLFLVTHDAPPMLIVHGTDDTMVPLSQSEALYLALQGAGTDGRMLTFDGGHSFAGTTAAERIAIAEAELSFIISTTSGQGLGTAAKKRISLRPKGVHDFGDNRYAPGLRHHVRKGFTMTASRVVFLGNCHAAALCEIYRRIMAPNCRGETAYVHAYTAADAEASGALANADHIMWQLTDCDQKIGSVETRGEIHLFPSVTCSFLWPYGGHPHPMNRSYPFLEAGPYPTTPGDAFLNQMITAGVEAKEAATRYIETDVARVKETRRMFEIVLDMQRTRDAECGSDYNLADLIDALISIEPLFRDRSHPHPPILRHIATVLFGRIGLGAEAENASYLGLMPIAETAIHSTVAVEFGMTFIKPDTQYETLYEGAFTFEESAIRYMRYEWNEGLAEAVYAYYRKHDPTRALTLLRKALPLSPRSDLGRKLLKHLEATSAKARASDLTDEAVAQSVAQASLAAGDREQALAIWAALRQSYPDRPEAYVHAGRVLADSRRFDELKTLLDDAVWRFADNPHITYLHATALSNTGEIDRAIEVLRSAIALGPDTPSLLVLLSHILAGQARLSEAANAARRAADASPHNAGIRGHLGTILFRLGQLEQAENELAAAIALAPEHALLQHHLAQVFDRQGRQIEAILAAQRAVGLNDANPHLHGFLGNLLVRANLLDAAAGSLTRAAALAPDEPAWRQALDRIRARQAEATNAREPVPAPPTVRTVAAAQL
jgi:tetratricopeptide (TPR) repeat protein/dienelactone hydrolase